MKKRTKFILATLAAVVVMIFCTPLRYCNIPLEGAGGSTSSIAESRERGVYLMRYSVPTNPIILTNGLRLNVKEAWAEREWIYPLFSNKTNVQYEPPAYRIYIAFDNEYDTLFRYFEGDENLRFGCYPRRIGMVWGKCLVRESTTTPPTQFERIPIVRMSSSAIKATPIDTLGYIELNAVDW